MEVRMKVTFNRQEVEEEMKNKYIEKFGKPSDEYELVVEERFGQVEVSMEKKIITNEKPELSQAKGDQ